MTQPSQRLARNLNWVVAANVMAGIGNFLALAWFARVLGPMTMGDYAIVVTAIQLIAGFLSAGLDQAVIRSPDDRDIAAASALGTIAQSLLLTVISGILYLYFFINAPDQVLGLTGPASLVLVAIILTLFANLVAAPIAARLDYRYLAMSRMVSTLFGISAGVAVADHEHGLYALALRDASAGLIMLLLCNVRVRFSFTLGASRAGLRRLFDFASGLWALNLTERLVLRLDYGIVGLLLGKEALGIYFVVRGIVEGMLGFLIYPVQTVLYAHYCQSECVARRVLPSCQVALFYVVICVCAAVFVFFVGPTALVLLVGESYLDAGAILPALVIYAGAILWFEIVKVLAMTENRHHRIVYARLIQMCVFLVLVFPAATAFGMVGASIATGVAGAMLAVISTRLAMVRGG